MRRTKVQMYPLIEEHLRDGVSRLEICEREKVSLGTFQYWIAKYRGEQGEESTDGFQALNISELPKNSCITISLPSGVKVDIPVN